MATDSPNANNIPDVGELTARLGKIAELSQRMVTDFMARQAAEAGQLDTDKNQDPLNIGNAYNQFSSAEMSHNSAFVVSIDPAQINIPYI